MAPVDSNGFEYAAVDSGNELLATIITAVILIVAVAAVIALCRRQRIWWPLLVLVSGGATFLCEPLFDHLYGLWFATEGQTTAVSTFGIDIPIWLPIIYVPYYGAWTVWLIRRFQRGATLAEVAKLFCLSALLAGLAETLYIQIFELYRYQDDQPFMISNYPIWVAVVNGVPPFLAAIVYTRMIVKLDGWWRLTFIPVVPICFAADSFGSGWLYLSARHGSEDPSMALLSVLAVFTTASAFGLVLTAAKVAGITDGPVEEPDPQPVTERTAVAA